MKKLTIALGAILLFSSCQTGSLESTACKVINHPSDFSTGSISFDAIAIYHDQLVLFPLDKCDGTRQFINADVTDLFDDSPFLRARNQSSDEVAMGVMLRVFGRSVKAKENRGLHQSEEFYFLIEAYEGSEIVVSNEQFEVWLENPPD